MEGVSTIVFLHAHPDGEASQTSGPVARYIVLSANSSPGIGAKGVTAFMIDTQLPGFHAGKSEPKLERPFMAPLFPYAPALALGLAILFLAAMIYYNQLLALIFGGLMLLGYGYFRLTHDASITESDSELARA